MVIAAGITVFMVGLQNYSGTDIIFSAFLKIKAWEP